MNARIALAVTFSIAPLLARLADEWRPAPRPVRSEWCVANLRMPSETSAQPGRFELTDHAYLREPLDAIDDVETREIVFPAPPQVGKSEWARAVVLSQGEVDRAPMMFAGPDEDYVLEQRDLMYGIAEASPATRERVPPRHRRNNRAIDLERSLVYLAWSGSTQRLSGRSCKKVVVSEADRWQHPIGLAFQRTAAFWGSSTVLVEGSPVGTESVIWSYYLQSDRRQYQLKCPHCGHWQPLRFFPHVDGPYAGCGGVAGLQEGERWLSPEEGRQAAYYCCEKGCALDDEDIAGAIPGGVWVPEGCRVSLKTGRVVGKPTHPGRRRGYHLWKLYSPATTLGDVAEAYLLARRQVGGLIGFWNDVLGLPAELPEIDLAVVSAQEVRERIGESRKGVVPDGAICVTAGIDTHRRHCKWTAIAFWPDGRSRIFDYGSFSVSWEALGSAESIKLAIREFAPAMQWTRLEGGEVITPTQTWLDTGYSEHTDALYEICEELNRGVRKGHEWIRPAKGYGTARMQTKYVQPTKKQKGVGYLGAGFHLGWLAKAHIYLVHCNADHFKSHLHECLKRPADEPEALTLYHGLPGEHEEFSEQLTAEIPTEDDGRIKWVRIRRANHFLDSTYNALAAGRFCLELLRRPKPAPRPKAQPQPTASDERPFLASDR